MGLYFDFDTPDNPDYLGLCNNADSEPVAVLKLVETSETIIDSWGTSDIGRWNENQAFTLGGLITISNSDPSLKNICKAAFDELAHATLNKVDLGEPQSDFASYKVKLTRPAMS